MALVVVLACAAAALSVGPAALVPALLVAVLIVVAPIFGPPSRASEHYRTGARGEQRVAAVLDQLVTGGRNHHPWAVLHDRRLPGREENIDHLLVTPEGVTVVETKNWSGGVRQWQGSWYAGRNSTDNAITQARRQIKAVRRILSRTGLAHVPVHGVVCLAGPAQLPRPLPLADVIVCGVTGLEQQLSSTSGPYDTRLLATVLDGAMPPA